MWQSVARWLGIELAKMLIAAFKDWLDAYRLKLAQAKKNERMAKIEKLLIAKEVARTTGDIANLDRITRELYKLQGDRDETLPES